MGIKSIVKQLDELRDIVSEWHDVEDLPTLEKDMALDRVKKIYEMLRFPTPDEVEQVEEQVEEEAVVLEQIIEEILIVEEEEVEPEPEPVPEEEISDEKRIKQERHRRILSLYDDEPSATNEYVAEEEQPQEQEPPSVSSSPINASPLVDLLGFNDRILLANELFGGDSDAMLTAMTKFDSFGSLDDLLYHIAQNYSWSGDGDGAKLLFATLQSRFS